MIVSSKDKLKFLSKAKTNGYTFVSVKFRDVYDNGSAQNKILYLKVGSLKGAKDFFDIPYSSYIDNDWNCKYISSKMPLKNLVERFDIIDTPVKEISLEKALAIIEKKEQIRKDRVVKCILDAYSQRGTRRTRIDSYTIIYDNVENNHKDSIINISTKKIRESSDSPIVKITIPPKPTKNLIWEEILRFYNSPFADKKNYSSKYYEAEQLLIKNEAPIIFVDGMHNIGKNQKSRLIINQLKSISGQTDIPVVLFGDNSTYGLMKVDEQAISRFRPLWIRQDVNPIQIEEN